MYPELLQIGFFSLPSFGVAVALAFLLGSWIAGWHARKLGWEEDFVPGLTVFMVIGSLIGAKSLFIIVYWNTMPFWEMLLSRYGFVFYGGLFGGWITLVLYSQHWKKPLREVADVVALALPFGQVLGRLGCLLNGCCFGVPTDLPFGVRFPVGTQPYFEHLEAGLISSDAPYSLPVHPTQVYEMVATLAIGVFLQYVWRTARRFSGQMMLLYLMMYGVARFVIECFRGDPRGAWPLLGISTSQGIAIVMVMIALVMWSRWKVFPEEKHV